MPRGLGGVQADFRRFDEGLDGARVAEIGIDRDEILVPVPDRAMAREIHSGEISAACGRLQPVGCPVHGVARGVQHQIGLEA